MNYDSDSNVAYYCFYVLDTFLITLHLKEMQFDWSDITIIENIMKILLFASEEQMSYFPWLFKNYTLKLPF